MRQAAAAAHLLSPRESVIEAGNVGHYGLLIGPESAHNICADKKEKGQVQSEKKVHIQPGVY